MCNEENLDDSANGVYGRHMSTVDSQLHDSQFTTLQLALSNEEPRAVNWLLKNARPAPTFDPAFDLPRLLRWSQARHKTPGAAVTCGWTPMTHHLYGAEAHRALRTLLLVVNRLENIQCGYVISESCSAANSKAAAVMGEGERASSCVCQFKDGFNCGGTICGTPQPRSSEKQKKTRGGSRHHGSRHIARLNRARAARARTCSRVCAVDSALTKSLAEVIPSCDVWIGVVFKFCFEFRLFTPTSMDGR